MLYVQATTPHLKLALKSPRELSWVLNLIKVYGGKPASVGFQSSDRFVFEISFEYTGHTPTQSLRCERIADLARMLIREDVQVARADGLVGVGKHWYALNLDDVSAKPRLMSPDEIANLSEEGNLAR